MRRGPPPNFIEVVPKSKRTRDGVDYRNVNPLGLVPALRTDGGTVLLKMRRFCSSLPTNIPRRDWRQAVASCAPNCSNGCHLSARSSTGRCSYLFDKALADTTKAKVLETGGRRLRSHGHLTAGPARGIQRGRRLLVHGLELEHRDARDLRWWASVESLRPHEGTAGDARSKRSLRF